MRSIHIKVSDDLFFQVKELMGKLKVVTYAELMGKIVEGKDVNGQGKTDTS